ncbi:helix-turn-helix domain-containing protein [Thalassobacillus devorans]|uniref:helix-turn-helix domain-containing protein n=1 Tax=Thalassobacillus devorans TaxID=279813 RepID=UPI000A1CD199|nr:AraC family transcriptional regulator [Thalassobacillus devorans]
MLTIKQTMIDQFMSIRTANTNQYAHPPYLMEQQLLEAITNKDRKRAILLLKNINQSDRIIQSKQHLRSWKNSVISSCTLFTRAAIKGGVDPDTAFRLNDAYLNKIEAIRSPRDISELEHMMLEDFIHTVEQADNLPYSPVINKAIAYIHDHILSDLTLEEISRECYVSPSYLSHLFKREVGVSIVQFINEKRIDESKYFLLHTSTSISDIAKLFQFCNQSYYTSVFKKYVKQTPRQYREDLATPIQEEC